MRRIGQRPTAKDARATRPPPMATLLRLATSLLAALIAACKPPPAADALLVVDPANLEAKGDGKLFRVDRAKGARILLSDFADEAQGPQGVDPFGLAAEVSGQLVITDPNAGTESKGALFRVEPGTGTRSLFSDFGDPAQGAEWMNPFGVAVEPKGSILVTDPDAGIDAKGALFRLDPQSGARTVLSDFGVPPDSPNSGIGRVAVDGKGQILITDTSAGTDAKGVLWGVHSDSGARTVLSDFGDPQQGPEEPDGPLSLVGLAVGSAGEIFVTSIDAGTESKGALFRVDPANGERRLLSDFGRTQQGPLGQDPTGVVVQ